MRTLELNDGDEMIFIILTFCLLTPSLGEPQVTDDGIISWSPRKILIMADFDERYPEENPGLFEGDIELTGVNPFNRNAVGNKNHLWPNGVVPYSISSSFTSHTRYTILSAMKEIRERTGNCITFVPRQSHHRYSVTYGPGRGCHSEIGFTGRHQKVHLGNGCLIKGIVMHETLHSLGFFHEQSRPDRDYYVQIIPSNIRRGYEGNFRKIFPPILDTQGFAYDYGSIMHYSRNSFAIDRRLPTIVPLQQGVQIGQRRALSPTDIMEIRRLYRCG